MKVPRVIHLDDDEGVTGTGKWFSQPSAEWVKKQCLESSSKLAANYQEEIQPAQLWIELYIGDHLWGDITQCTIL